MDLITRVGRESGLAIIQSSRRAQISAGLGFSVHSNVRELGFSACPCFCGKLSPIRGSLRRPITKNAPSSLRFNGSPPRSELPEHDDNEKTGFESPESSSDYRRTPSAGFSGGQEEPGNSGEKLPRIPYGLVTGLASVGFVETAYLSWEKVSGGTVVCPVGGSCTDVLDSSYATVFGIPLSLIGLVAYGAVAGLGASRLLSSSSSRGSVEEEKRLRWLPLGITTTMASASIYFMYILLVKLEGAECAYCVSSAVLSLSLLVCSLQGFTRKDVLKMAGLQSAVGALVVLALSLAFVDADSLAKDLDLKFAEPEVRTSSPPRVISLAKHLQSVGAKMYGAFWCSHCYEQKEMFGREAMKYIDYVECYPEGYRKGAKIAEACDAANILGFPTWIIKGQVLSGEQGLDDLAKVSDFMVEKS